MKAIGIDIFQGCDVSQALYNAVSPFRVMKVAELFVLSFPLFFTESAYLFIKKRERNKSQ